MRFLRSFVLLSPSVVVVFMACDGDAPAPSDVADNGRPDATTTPPEGNDGATSDDGGLMCDPPVNGTLKEQDGTFQATIANTGANLAKSEPGTIPCEAHYDPNAGVSQGDNQYSGGFSITCLGNENGSYFGLMLNGFGKPKASDTFPIGHAASVALGDGGYGPNGQVDLSWEEGPTCDTKQGNSKSWNGEAGGSGALVIDTVSGTNVTFHITETNLAVSTNGLNYKGTGTFKVSGTGSLTMKGL